MPCLCADCQIDTTPCTGKRGCRHKGKWEYYMVQFAMWKAVGAGDRYLCIGCLEQRLGRQLKPADFICAPINEPGHPWTTERLESRLTRQTKCAN